MTQLTPTVTVLSIEPLISAPAPAPLSFGHSMSMLGYQLPSPIVPIALESTFDSVADDLEYNNNYIDNVELSWRCLYNEICEQIVDSEENRTRARKIIMDIIKTPYANGIGLQIPTQDQWVPALDALREIIQQWSNIDSMIQYIDDFEYAFINFVSWLYSLESPNEYYSQYTSRIWSHYIVA
jgi:hypothetical protein